VHVDHVGYGATPSGSRLSIDGGNPIDSLDLSGVALYAPTEAALREQYGYAHEALAAGAELVVVTRGDKGSVAYARDGTVAEAPSPRVDAVSTLGAGDVFHGALLANLLRNAPLADALALANTCAALSCRSLDARSAIPTLEELAA
jgi:sugar/nucleoside kinase (ribokinase family)